MQTINWKIGCSGFHYREWKEEFYPIGLAQKNWFDYYASHFNTLEINSTFYKFPTLKTLKDWADKAPDGFTFSTKVPRWITHYHKFTGTERMMEDFYGLLKEGMMGHLDCVLFQLPPLLSYSKELLEKIIAHCNPLFQNAVEFRNESWWRKDVQATLKKHNIIFCGVSFPKIVCEDVIINLPKCYYRFHGVPRLFYSEYSPEFIEKVYNQIQQNKKVTTALVYFNNTASLAALHNAKYLKQLVQQGTEA